MSFQSLSKHAADPIRRGFTLAEILVSVGILIAILLVAGRVFQTAQQVSNMGNAAADVLQETAAIEKQIRADIEQMSPQGMIAIHSVRVQNDQRIIDWQLGGGEGPRPGLINPNLEASAKIRCDQIVFLKDGISRLKQYGSDGYLTTADDGAAGADWYPKLLGEGAMVYYGHAVQFPDELKAANMNEPLNEEPPFRHGHDIAIASLSQPITPWFDGGIDPQVPTVYRRYARSVTDEDAQGDNFDYSYQTQAAEPIRGSQPEARKWILARQEILFGQLPRLLFHNLVGKLGNKKNNFKKKQQVAWIQQQADLSSACLRREIDLPDGSAFFNQQRLDRI